MTAETATQDFTTNSGASWFADRTVRPDIECWARTREFLTELIGSPPDDLLWDDTHHLQGHSRLHGREFIVIAPRDDDHRTVVLTAEDWHAIRRAGTDHRRDLLDACAIADHNRFVAVLGHHRNGSSVLTAA